MRTAFGWNNSIQSRNPKIMALVLFLTMSVAGCGSNHQTSGDAAREKSSTSGSHEGHSAAAVAPTPRVPAFVADVASARPLPAVMNPGQFAHPVVAKAYRYAQELPEVFAQQPCYCYCDDGFGHRSLLDCFASDHSASCELCVKEGLLIYRLHHEGKNPTQIREMIVRGDWQSVPLQ